MPEQSNKVIYRFPEMRKNKNTIYGGEKGICKERKARRNSAAKRSVTRSVPAFRSVTQARQN